MRNMQELFELSNRELNEFLWKDFAGEEEDLTEEEKKAWEVRR